ncbi:MAG TPA: DEAD/DEAH box helicase family protein [Ktedonobacterales bacterium]
MPRKKTPSDQLSLFEVEEYLKTAPCVPLLRQKVGEWRAAGYPGATDVTKKLLNWWFNNDHRQPDGRLFAYHRAQREAIETLIYVYEIARIRSRRQLYEEFARADEPIRLATEDKDHFARYATKMATGSGKTKVMSLAIVWHYFNAVMGGSSDYARTFLIVAPNVIVLERLAEDFAGGRIFQRDPVMPPDMRFFWEMETVVRGDPERPGADGLVLLTNIQQLYDRPVNGDDESEPLAAVLGPKAPATLSESASFIEQIHKRSGALLVINDEAHHTHDEGSAWNSVIQGLHEARPIAAQLDFSATPRFTKGQLFPWVISDYPLKQAIIDGIVKRPYKGVTDLDVVQSEHASVKYHGFLVAGVNRWREYREQLAPFGKRPLLFIMLTSNAEADEVGARLAELYPTELSDGRTLVIHTDSKGEITKKDLDVARRAAREVDMPESRINAIVSVLMLREGWDCLDAQTEVLTLSGWKGMGQLSEGEPIYSFNIESRKLEVVPVLEYGERDVRGDEQMVSIRSQYLNIRVTEGHRFYLRYWDGRNRQPSGNIIMRTGRELAQRRSDYMLPLSAETGEPFPGVPLSDDEIRLVAWFMTDGGFVFGGQEVSITQSEAKPHHHAIRALLQLLNLDYREEYLQPGATAYPNSKPHYRFNVPKGTHSGSLARNGWYAYRDYLDKNVAPALHNMTRRQFQLFWEELLKGDGEQSGGNKAGWLWCCSKEQVDAYTHMAVVRGFSASFHEEITSAGKTVYRVSVRDAQWITSRPSDPRASRIRLEAPEPGETVWCISNRNGTLVTRRHGKIAIIGNCTSVTVVVGLRPYNAKANILPEQTIGRGLRLMFRGEGAGYTERVDIIGTSGFMQFVDNLEQLEQVELGEFEVGKDKLTILTIQPDPEKEQYDIAIPQLTPILARKRSITAEIEALDVRRFMNPPFPRKPGDEQERTFRYDGLDFVTMQREFSREYTLPTPQTANEVIGYYARLIASDLKLPSQFAVLAPKVKEFFAVKAFGGEVNLDDPTIIQAISRVPVAHVVRKLFTNALRDKIIEEQEPELVDSGRSLAQVQPFPFSNPNATPGRKLILNYAPCGNDYERRFAKFLDDAPDIAAWCKVPDNFRFSIEYTDQNANLRYYYPDFVAIAADGMRWIIETKGAETVEVRFKDNAARIWCDNATQLTGVAWNYIKVSQKDFDKMDAKDFGDITLLQW